MNVTLKLAARREMKNHLLVLCQHMKIRDDDQLIIVLQANIGVMMEDVGMAIDLCFRDEAMWPPPWPLPNQPPQGQEGEEEEIGG